MNMILLSVKCDFKFQHCTNLPPFKLDCPYFSGELASWEGHLKFSVFPDNLEQSYRPIHLESENGLLYRWGILCQPCY